MDNSVPVRNYGLVRIGQKRSFLKLKKKKEKRRKKSLGLTETKLVNYNIL